MFLSKNTFFYTTNTNFWKATARKFENAKKYHLEGKFEKIPFAKKTLKMMVPL